MAYDNSGTARSLRWLLFYRWGWASGRTAPSSSLLMRCVFGRCRCRSRRNWRRSISPATRSAPAGFPRAAPGSPTATGSRFGHASRPLRACWPGAQHGSICPRAEKPAMRKAFMSAESSSSTSVFLRCWVARSPPKTTIRHAANQGRYSVMRSGNESLAAIPGRSAAAWCSMVTHFR